MSILSFYEMIAFIFILSRTNKCVIFNFPLQQQWMAAISCIICYFSNDGYLAWILFLHYSRKNTKHILPTSVNRLMTHFCSFFVTNRRRLKETLEKTFVRAPIRPSNISFQLFFVNASFHFPETLQVFLLWYEDLDFWLDYLVKITILLDLESHIKKTPVRNSSNTPFPILLKICKFSYWYMKIYI